MGGGDPSETVKEVCHRLLILLKGSEAVSEPSGHLTGARLCLRQVATLSEDLLGVGVVRLIDHATIISTGSDALGSLVDTCPTGRAAAQFVLLSPPTDLDSIH